MDRFSFLFVISLSLAFASECANETIYYIDQDSTSLKFGEKVWNIPKIRIFSLKFSNFYRILSMPHSMSKIISFLFDICQNHWNCFFVSNFNFSKCLKSPKIGIKIAKKKLCKIIPKFLKKNAQKVDWEVCKF